jgi:hypothetical protein
MTESTRPKRVVIVDADNPLQEVHGEFFWREDHERIVADERNSSYLEGYRRGLEAATHSAPATIKLQATRPRLFRRAVVRALALLVLAAFIIDVLVPAIFRAV